MDRFFSAIEQLDILEMDGSVTGYYVAGGCTGARLCYTVALDLSAPLPEQIRRALAEVPREYPTVHSTVRRHDGVLIPTLHMECYRAS